MKLILDEIEQFVSLYLSTTSNMVRPVEDTILRSNTGVIMLSGNTYRYTFGDMMLVVTTNSFQIGNGVSNFICGQAENQGKRLRVVYNSPVPMSDRIRRGKHSWGWSDANIHYGMESSDLKENEDIGFNMMLENSERFPMDHASFVKLVRRVSKVTPFYLEIPE